MEIRINSLGARGDGIAESGEGTVYVPDALPGELVRVGKTLRRGDGQRAVVRDVVEASPDRISPACGHFGTCGGCAAQHMDAGLYAAWKRDLVRNSLARAGVDAEVLTTVSVLPSTRRRVRLGFRQIRDSVIAGFREAGSDRIVDLAECPSRRRGSLGSCPRSDVSCHVLQTMARLPLRRRITGSTSSCSQRVNRISIFVWMRPHSATKRVSAACPGLMATACRNRSSWWVNLWSGSVMWRCPCRPTVSCNRPRLVKPRCGISLSTPSLKVPPSPIYMPGAGRSPCRSRRRENRSCGRG